MQAKSHKTTIHSSIIDNRNRGKVGDYLKSNISYNSKLSIVSAYFTIYAYKSLQKELDSINKLDFLFGEPTFIKSIDPSKTDKKQFKIEDDQLVIPIENRLQQKKYSQRMFRMDKTKS